jgi:hypothetical protein
MNYEPFDITRARDYERALQRVATRGIVQLFNTVRKQQQNSSSSTKKEKKESTINKGEFLDMLKTIDSDEVSYKIMKKNQSTVKEKSFLIIRKTKSFSFRSNQRRKQHQSDGMFFKMTSWPV